MLQPVSFVNTAKKFAQFAMAVAIAVEHFLAESTMLKLPRYFFEKLLLD
jgi:hypothetical protein